MCDALDHAKTCWFKHMLHLYSTMVYLPFTTCKRLAFCLQGSFHLTLAHVLLHQAAIHTKTQCASTRMQLSVYNNLREHAYTRAKAFAHLCINTALADKSSRVAP